MPRKKATCKQCGMFREIVGFDLCLKCYSQKRRDDLGDGIPPLVIGPDESQRRDRHDMAIQRQNLAKILAILEGKPIDGVFLPPDRKRQICTWLIEAINLINATVTITDSCRDNSENEIAETTEAKEHPKLLLEPESPDQEFKFKQRPMSISGDARRDVDE
jgi:hypothetical protein